MRRFISLALATVFTAAMSVLALQVPPGPPPTFSGKVIAIADGDTLTVLVDKQQHRIRLEGIDAPESGQAFGTKAKQVLGNKVFSKDVTVKWKSRDKYQRILGHVYLGERHINVEMVQEGFAWHFTRYSSDQGLARAEKAARAAQAGLWAEKSPIAPWDFRRGIRSASDAAGGNGAVQAIAGDPSASIATMTVYVTSGGAKYHQSGCRYLSKSMIAMPLQEACSRYGPCSVCKPPVLPPNRDPRR